MDSRDVDGSGDVSSTNARYPVRGKDREGQETEAAYREMRWAAAPPHGSSSLPFSQCSSPHSSAVVPPQSRSRSRRVGRPSPSRSRPRATRQQPRSAERPASESRSTSRLDDRVDEDLAREARTGHRSSAVSATKTAKFVDTNTLPVQRHVQAHVDPNLDHTGHGDPEAVRRPAGCLGAMTLGGPSATVTTTVPGQNASFTFSGVSGHRVCARTHGRDGLRGERHPPQSRLTVLDGPKAFATAGTFIDPLTLTQTGTYTLCSTRRRAPRGR